MIRECNPQLDSALTMPVLKPTTTKLAPAPLDWQFIRTDLREVSAALKHVQCMLEDNCPRTALAAVRLILNAIEEES